MLRVRVRVIYGVPLRVSYKVKVRVKVSLL
jgi:hypothetical protein